MAKVLVLHFTEENRLPELSEQEFTEVRNGFLDALKDYPDTHFNGTFVDENGMGVCIWEAPSAEVVEEVIKKVLPEPPVDAVIEVNQVLL